MLAIVPATMPPPIRKTARRARTGSSTSPPIWARIAGTINTCSRDSEGLPPVAAFCARTDDRYALIRPQIGSVPATRYKSATTTVSQFMAGV